MPLKTPIPWAGKPQLIERDGTATPYFQRILDQIMTDAASVQDIVDAELLATAPLTASIQDQIDNATLALQQTQARPTPDVSEIALLAASMVPCCGSGSGSGDMTAEEVAALGYWAPVTDATDPMDPLFVFDAEGQCVVAFVPTP